MCIRGSSDKKQWRLLNVQVEVVEHDHDNSFLGSSGGLHNSLRTRRVEGYHDTLCGVQQGGGKQLAAPQMEQCQRFFHSIGRLNPEEKKVVEMEVVKLKEGVGVVEEKVAVEEKGVGEVFCNSGSNPSGSCFG